MEDNKSRLGFWGWFGRVSAVVILIGGIILIYQFVASQWFSPDAPKLKVTGEYYEWPSIETSIRADWFWRFDIENTGGEIAKNVRIDFPFFGKIDTGNGSELKEFNNETSIQVGDLQPSDKRTLRVWSWGGNIYKDYVYKDDIKVIHDGGVEKINYPVQVHGMVAWIVNNSFVLLLGAFIIIWIGSLLMSEIWQKKQGKNLSDAVG